MDSNDPKNWKIRKLADFGSSEPWVARIWLTLKEFVDQLKLHPDKKKSTSDAYDDLFTTLSMVFTGLRNIIKLSNDDKTPLVTLQKEYFDFYDKLWLTLKDRLQKALKEMDFNIGFFFMTDEKFAKGLDRLVIKYNIDDKTKQEIISDRVWSNRLSNLRNNYLQHKKLSKDIENEFFSAKQAQVYFHNCWTFIEDLSLLAMEQHLHPIFIFEEIPEDKRDPSIPRRFNMTINPKLIKHDNSK